MACKCLDNKCALKEYTMKCDKCGNQQFYTRRNNHIPVAYVCGICGNEAPVKNKKEVKEEQNEIKEAE